MKNVSDETTLEERIEKMVATYEGRIEVLEAMLGVYREVFQKVAVSVESTEIENDGLQAYAGVS